jgi:hypothetical protein
MRRGWTRQLKKQVCGLKSLAPHVLYTMTERNSVVYWYIFDPEQHGERCRTRTSTSS